MTDKEIYYPTTHNTGATVKRTQTGTVVYLDWKGLEYKVLFAEKATFVTRRVTPKRVITLFPAVFSDYDALVKCARDYVS